MKWNLSLEMGKLSWLVIFWGFYGWKKFPGKFRTEIFGGLRLKLKNSGEFPAGGKFYGAIGWEKFEGKFGREIFGGW